MARRHHTPTDLAFIPDLSGLVTLCRACINHRYWPEIHVVRRPNVGLDAPLRAAGCLRRMTLLTRLPCREITPDTVLHHRDILTFDQQLVSALVHCGVFLRLTERVISEVI